MIPDHLTFLLWAFTAMDWEVRHGRALVAVLAVLVLTGIAVCAWRKAEPPAIRDDHTPLDDLLDTREET